jgi:MerR family transcriptional regulator/heat shock protein HspR
MTVQQYQIVFRGTDDQRLTLEDAALHAAMHPAMVEQLVEFGLVTPLQREGTNLFDPSVVLRLRTIGRLRRALGINLTGISVILDLVDKMRSLQRENENLRNRL